VGDSSGDETGRSVIRKMNVTCHLAAFFPGFRSKGQEIDDKMPSNSSWANNDDYGVA
jgi:hypothetical protein